MTDRLLYDRNSDSEAFAPQPSRSSIVGLRPIEVSRGTSWMAQNARIRCIKDLDSMTLLEFVYAALADPPDPFTKLRSVGPSG